MELSSLEFDGHLFAAKVSLPFLPLVRTIEIHGELENGAKPSTKQASYYNSLSQEDFPTQDQLDDSAYTSFLKAAGIVDVREFGLNNVSRSNIRSHYRIENVVIPPIRKSLDRFLVILGECAWDPEHGIQFVVKNSRIISVSDQDGVFQGRGWDRFLKSSKM